MVERLLLVLVLAVVGYAIYRWVVQHNLQQVAEQAPDDPILRDAKTGIPTIVYFTTPQCIPCKTQQQPALQRLLAELGENLQVIQIDATEQPDAAQRWGVMTAPTTFVLGKDGTPKAVNYGAVTEHTLKQQLQGAA